MQLRVWRANVAKGEVRVEQIPQAWERLGGRPLIARVLLDEVPPACDPLGPSNKLIFAPGLLVGGRVSSCDRLSIGGKSPLTGGVKESNAGGTSALIMNRIGMKALMLEGEPPGEDWRLLHLHHQGGRFEPADDLRSLGVYQTAQILRQRYGSKVGLALIGPGGEMRLRSAGILNLDKDGEPSRIAARGGLGAVMGAKRIKAIIIDAAGGQSASPADQDLLKEARKRLAQVLREHPQVIAFTTYGTAANVNLTDRLGVLPTRGFSSGTFAGAERISGESLRELILARGGEGDAIHACMPGCVIRCSNVVADRDGKKIISPLEYETIALCGSNLGLDDLEAIARINWELNDLGLDSIEIGAALGVAAQAGLMGFGDAERVLALLHEVREGTPLGRVLGSGAAVTGRVFGVRRVPAVKGQAIAAYDPRALKGTGVTYATSPQGADHSAGLTLRAKVDHLDPKGQAQLSRAAQINMAGYDTLGACLFAGFGLGLEPQLVKDLLQGLYGWEVGEDALQELGKETLRLEKRFNRAAGFGSAKDRLPEWMTLEPLPPHNTVFDVPEEELDHLFDDLEAS